MRQDIRVLADVYEKVDKFLSGASFMAEGGQEQDPAEAAVLALVRAVLPLVAFRSAPEAIAELRARSRATSKRPVPQAPLAPSAAATPAQQAQSQRQGRGLAPAGAIPPLLPQQHFLTTARA
mmetsp:Transcript_175187/g.556461  ORF Transcript_175187/g.556461 Transcript_175187/m.556461 type:complete len:122 (-) Transcript_175187:8-373(-)